MVETAGIYFSVSNWSLKYIEILSLIEILNCRRTLIIEYKIFRWLDFTYSFERFNLKGTKTDLTLDILLGNPGLLIIGASLSDFMVVGTAQNAGFIFKYSTWFSTKFGVISEKYVRTYNSNYTLSDDPTTILVGSLLYSSIVQSTSTLNNAYWQFEFSKGF